MKRVIAFLTVSMMLVSALHADLTNSILIDFEMTGDMELLSTNYELMSNEQATYSLTATPDELVDISLTNLHNNYWEVWLNASARIVENRRYSYCTNVARRNDTNAFVFTNKDTTAYPGNGTTNYVLGVRIHFPRAPWNSYAIVRPKYAVEFYGGTNGEKYEKGLGVVKNVGVIHSLSSWICGRNFKILYYVNLRNEKERLKSYPMGYLYFRGWRKLQWKNINYLNDARDRELVRKPIYPYTQPGVRIDSLKFYRHSEVLGGNFITYVKDVQIKYDEEIPSEDRVFDIEDEGVWNILSTEARKKRDLERKRLQERMELLELEERKMRINDDQNAGGAGNP